MRGEVLQRELVFLRAPLGFATMRDILQQHGVNAPGARIEVDDRELHVTPFVIAANELRGTTLGGLVVLAGGQRYRCVEDRRDVAASQLVERRADEALCLRIRVQHAPRSRVEQHDARRGAIEDRAIAGFAVGRRHRGAPQATAVGVPRDHDDADQQRDPDDQVAHALLAALHDVSRQRGVHHGERVIVDGVEAQLAFDDIVRTAHDSTTVRRDQQFRLFRRYGALVEHRELHIELGVGADAGDFRRSDAAREYQRAGGRAAAVAVQDGLGGDDVRHAVDLHQSQRAFLIEDRRERSASGD